MQSGVAEVEEKPRDVDLFLSFVSKAYDKDIEMNWLVRYVIYPFLRISQWLRILQLTPQHHHHAQLTLP